MKQRLSMTGWIMFAVLAVALITHLPTYAQQSGHDHSTMQQHMGHQHSMMQQNMNQMHEMMQHMDQVMQRADHISQNMAAHMKHNPGQMMDQYQMVQQMGESMNTMAGHLKMTMEQCTQMLQDPGIMNNPDMKQDMDHLIENMMSMADQMGKTIESVEKVSSHIDLETAGK